MLKNLPYTSLRAFEAVARLRKFGRAANELGMSQSAVSQHVRNLEEWTNQKLLIRGHSATIPTSVGRQLADAVAGGLGQVSSVCDQIRSREFTDSSVVISCPPGFAVNWLFPRLIDFDQRYPDIPVSISTAIPADGQLSGIEDLAIRYGLGRFVGMQVDRLMSETVFPVCSPLLLDTVKCLMDGQGASNITFLVDDITVQEGNQPNWHYWARRVGVHLPAGRRELRYSQANMAVQAAIQGFGVALGRQPLVIDALVDGRLVRPFRKAVRSEYSYWCVCPRYNLDQHRIMVLREWLVDQSKQQAQLPPHVRPASNASV